MQPERPDKLLSALRFTLFLCLDTSNLSCRCQAHMPGPLGTPSLVVGLLSSPPSYFLPKNFVLPFSICFMPLALVLLNVSHFILGRERERK